jgi:hypothetical protein
MLRRLGLSAHVVTGVLDALIVRSIDARQRELCRRLEASESAIVPAPEGTLLNRGGRIGGPHGMLRGHGRPR